MKRKTVLLAALVLAASSMVFAESRTKELTKAKAASQHPSKPPTIEQLATALSEAFIAKDLRRLDDMRARLGAVRIEIDHSLSDDVETRTLKSFTAIERWLKRRERGGIPGRISKALEQCQRGVCTYEQSGMLHNNLFLVQVNYVVRKGRPYIRVIHVIDGD